jgi:uracil-DNA glycosylase
VSDARERLRQYLEQRRELGESEFVLDSLSVEDALKVLTTGATPPAAPAPRTAGTGGSGAPAAPRGPVAEPPRASRTEGVTEDWRAIVSAPDPAPTRAGDPAPAAPPRAAGKRAKPTTDDAPAAAAPVPADLASAKTLADIAKAISICKACSLSATALNHVPGEGNPEAKFVIVGEAPGATEDELGRPFVGKSGDLLTKILEAIGFKREDVFICNVLKHRPPGNRNPTPEEVVACAPYLLKQLDVLQPKVILALGNFAAQTLLNTDVGITKLRGVEHTYHGIPLVATFHPAALLRNPNFKRPAWEDVQLARRIFDRP